MQFNLLFARHTIINMRHFQEYHYAYILAQSTTTSPAMCNLVALSVFQNNINILYTVCQMELPMKNVTEY